MLVDETVFAELGDQLFRRAHGISSHVRARRFRALFGLQPSVIARVWLLLDGKRPPNAQPCHLMWALLLLKVYATEHVNCVLTGVDEKTFRKWTWCYIRLISELQLLNWPSRLSRKSIFGCTVSVDGTDCMIQEPRPFSKDWYSHKFKGAGLRYEIGMTIEDGSLIWANGPFPCGLWPDISIFRLNMKNLLATNERVLGDSTYRDEGCVPPSAIAYNKHIHNVARARHEAVNARIKNFFAVGHVFRHRRSLHSYCFHAIVNLVHIDVQENPLFDVRLS